MKSSDMFSETVSFYKIDRYDGQNKIGLFCKDQILKILMNNLIELFGCVSKSLAIYDRF